MLVLPALGGQLRLRQSDRDVARAGGQPMELERIGGKANAPSQRSEHSPGVTPSHGEILADGQDDAACRVGEGSVVDILADVILIETHQVIGG